MRKKKYDDAIKVSIPEITASLTEHIIKVLELLEANLEIEIKLKMIERELKLAKYEGFKACQILPKELLGTRTKSLIYKLKWSFFRGRY